MNPTLQALFGAGGPALSSSGRNGDSMMAHLSPAAAATLKRAGGAGTTNPVTGAREYYTQDQLGAAQAGMWNTATMGEMPGDLRAIYSKALGLPAPQPAGSSPLPASDTSRYGAPSDVQGIWDGMTDDQRTGVLRGIGWSGGIDDSLNAWAKQNSGTFESAFRNWAGGGQAPATPTPATPTTATPAARYGAPSDVQALWDLMTPQQQQNAVKQAGWSGGIDDSLNQWVASGNQSAFENAVRANRYSAPTAVQQRFDALTPQQRDAALSGAGWTGGSSNPDLNQWALNNKNTFENAIMGYGKTSQTPGLSYDTLGSALSNLSKYFTSASTANPFGSLSGLYGGASPFFQQSGSFGSGAGGNYLSGLSSLFGAGSSTGSLFGGSASSGSASSTSPSANPFGASSGAFARSSRSMLPTKTGLI